MFHVGGSSLGEQFFERFGMYTYTMIVASLGAVPLVASLCMYEFDGYILLLRYGARFCRCIPYRTEPWS